MMALVENRVPWGVSRMGSEWEAAVLATADFSSKGT